jgi:hypothetical protein
MLADGGLGDVGPDAAPVCVGVGNYLVCVPGGIPDRLEYQGTTTIITDQPCPLFDSSHPTWCIYAAHHVSVTGNLRATGSQPFVLIGTDDLTIGATGIIDVASHVAVSPGAGIGAGGGNATQCVTAGTGNTGDGGGGGAGATYSTQGGRGGDGNASGGSPAAVDPQGILATTLRGGCSGGSGGPRNIAGVASDPGGAGGGALYLASKGSMTISGSVNASGAGGGRGNTPKGGGSGGGSGGTIVLWATGLAVTGQVFANGGGGGGGSDTGSVGNHGDDAMSAETSALGGSGGGSTMCGTGPGCGGQGAAKSGGGQAGYNDTTSAGGGGGGGGLGVIRILSGQVVNGTFSPMPLRN